MTSLIVSKSGPLRGASAVSGDKSITHRALILGALAEGTHRCTVGCPPKCAGRRCAASGRWGSRLRMCQKAPICSSTAWACAG